MSLRKTLVIVEIDGLTGNSRKPKNARIDQMQLFNVFIIISPDQLPKSAT